MDSAINEKVLYGPFIELETESEFYKRKFLELSKKMLYASFIPGLLFYSYMDYYFYSEGIINKRYGIIKISLFLISASLGVSLLATPLFYKHKTKYFTNIYNHKKTFFDTMEEERLRSMRRDIKEIEELNNK